MYQRNGQGWTKHLDFLILDELVLQLSLILAFYVRQGQSAYAVPIYRNLAAFFVLADLVIILMFNRLHNVLKRGLYQEMMATLTLCISVFGLGTAFVFVAHSGESYSRIVLVLTMVFHMVLGFITRCLWKQVLWKTRIMQGSKGSMLVVLHASTAEEMMQRLLERDIEAHIIIGAVLDEETNKKEIAGIPVVCRLEEVSDYLVDKWVDAVYIDCAATDPRIKELMTNCSLMGITLHYHVPAIGGTGNKRFVEKISGTTVLTSSLNYATPMEAFFKRVLDILGGIVGSLLALLIMAIVGPKIKKASPGPILYSQERIGLNGKRFKMYKIRSMYLDADARKKELMDQNRVKDGMMFKLDFDPRVIGNEILPDGTKKTGIGEFIRQKSLDEFPQFFNVLMGQMSLVGTRPPTVDEWEKYDFHHRARLACKPGITGLWQVSGRSEITDFEEVVRLDTEYIMNWSFVNDLKILLQTVLVVLKGRGAM